MNKVKPTRLQKATVEIIAENPTYYKDHLGEAMVKGGYSPKSAEAPGENFLDREGTAVAIEQWREKLRGIGITDEFLAAKMMEMLTATKIKSSMTEPDKTVPDYDTQLEAVKMIRTDLGIDSGVTVHNNQQNNFFISDEQLERLVKE